MHRVTGIAATIAATMLVSTPAAQEPVFRSDARTVAIYATVVDRDHHLVTDLTRDDFEVRDDDTLVDISPFSAEPVPIALGVVIDASASMAPHTALMWNATQYVIDHLDPPDAAMVAVFNRHMSFSPLLSDHAALHGFVGAYFEPGGETPLWDAMDRAMVELRPAATRRVMLVFSDGIVTEMHGHSYGSVARNAAAEDVMVYTIGFWNNVRFAGGLSDLDPPGGDLHKIADETGGGYVDLKPGERVVYDTTFGRVMDELHHQYVLGFTPAKLDGKVHKIDVRVKRAGLTARARKSYVAALDTR